MPVSAPAGSGQGGLPPILWPCCGVLIAGALGAGHHDAWAAVAIFAAIILLLAVAARSAGAGAVAVTLIALAGALFRTTPPTQQVVIWPTENVNAVRATVAAWPTPHGETVQTAVAVVGVRTDRGWQSATATLRAILPVYPPLNRDDVVVIGGMPTLHRDAQSGTDGFLYGQWARIEQRDTTTAPVDVRHRAITRFIAGIERHVRSPEADLTAGMLLGEKAVLDTPTRDALNATGTTQHVVISGWNISLVIGLFAALGRGLAIRQRRVWAIAALATVALYTFAVGADLSVVRAAVMGGATLVAPLVGRRADPLVWLALACAAMTLIDPAVTHDLSFLLSCSATFGVLVVAPWLAGMARRVPAGHRFPHITELAAVAVAAYLMTEPIILHTFGRASLISPVINIIVEPLVPVIMGFGLITALLSFVPVPLLGDVAGLCAALPTWLFLRIIDTASALPISVVQLPQPGLDITALVYALPASIACRAQWISPVVRTVSTMTMRRMDAALYALSFAGTLIAALVIAAWLR
jgi:ComEC/Rec2-related protein